MSMTSTALQEEIAEITPAYVSGGTTADASLIANQTRSVRLLPATARSTSGSVQESRVAAAFRAIRNWEGVVASVDGHAFTASMKDTSLPREARPIESFEIPIDDVPEGDRELIQRGAIFYLTLGKIAVPGEQPQKTTRLIFRRLPGISKRDLEAVEEEAQDLFALQKAAFEKQFPGEAVPSADS